MSSKEAMIPLRWPGSDTLKAARAAVRGGMPVDIELPLEVHYALYKHLNRPPAASEDIDVCGGAELLEPIATVAGLEDLRQLEPALRKGRYSVRVTSPEPRLRLTPPESRGQAPHRGAK